MSKAGKSPCDELDIIEACGGEEPHAPNAFTTSMPPHFRDQDETGKANEKAAFESMRKPIRMRRSGISSTWHEAFHTYGCKNTEIHTIDYRDNAEDGRHTTLPLSKSQTFFFLNNLATGGGWPVDLTRYHGLADTKVDFVRVYQKSPR